MNYETAKKLKDAGFPQCGDERAQIDNYAEILIHERKSGKSHEEACKIAEETAEVCYIPTLSELIDACGDGFLSLRFMNKDDIKGTNYKEPYWIADTRTHDCNCSKEKGIHLNWEVGEGKTPKIATANLWLELNKKTDTSAEEPSNFFKSPRNYGRPSDNLPEDDKHIDD